MRHEYRPKGVCSSRILLDIEGGVIKDIEIENGCDGSLHGIARLLKGVGAAQAAEKLSGIKCGRKNTSCPDQIAEAIRAALLKGNEN